MNHQTDTNNNVEDDRPVVPFAGVVYGDIIYWGTIAGTIITIIGGMVMFMTKNNFISPSYLISAVWEGKNVDQIWQGAVGSTPNGHWYLSEIFTGNGLTMLGMAMGVFSVTPAIVGAAVILFREKQRLFGSLALIAAAFTVLAMLGFDFGLSE